MIKATLQLETLTCPSCLVKIDKALKALDGVKKDSVNVMFNSSKAKLEFDETKVSLEQITNTIKNLGYIIKKAEVK